MIQKKKVARKRNALPPVVADTMLRKLALSQQGLLHSASFGAGVSAVADAVAHLGYIQIDTISVVERAHHHVLWNRMKGYQPEHLARLVEQKKIFEYWFHAAAFLPLRDFRYALPRMNAIRAGEKHWFDNIDKKLIRSVRKRIETEGPLMARDFKDSRSGNTGWWDWKPAKQALEKLFMQGDLTVVGREGFQKRYDLTERWLPEHVDTSTPDAHEEASHLINTNLRAHGFCHQKSFTYLRRGKPLRHAVAECISALQDQKKLVLIQNSAGDQFYADPERLEQSYRVSNKACLLSPFDNLVIQRERCRSVFDFDYQIECYVPEAKRKYGYFCLPVLYKDKLVGRADLKADRKTGMLRVKLLQTDLKSERFYKALASGLKDFMKFNQCNAITLEKVESKTLLKKYLN